MTIAHGQKANGELAPLRVNDSGELVVSSSGAGGGSSVQMGAGAVTATTQRVTLASDGPEVTNSTGILAKLTSIDSRAASGAQGVTPHAASSAFTSSACAASAQTFAAQACTALLVNNATGTAIDLQFGGTGTAFKLNDGQMVLIPGISNANAVTAKRSDGGATSVTVSAMAVTK